MSDISLYCSTGTIISIYNGFDYTLMYSVLPSLVSDCSFDGYEFMMLKAFYDKTDEISDYMSGKMRFSVFHAEKEIGVLISNGTVKEGIEATRLFEINCRFAEKLGAKKIVLHLWGGHGSDHNFEHNLSFVGNFCKTAAEHGLELLVENVPCAGTEPLSHWNRIAEIDENVRFLYDTRFGEFHRQHDRILDSDLFRSGKVDHIHISDFIGAEREFSRLRPILHPGEGQVNFEHIFAKVRDSGYKGSITLESPVAREDGSLNTERLVKTMKYVSEAFKK